jgi:hypothetical protein
MVEKLDFITVGTLASVIDCAIEFSCNAARIAKVEMYFMFSIFIFQI